MEDSGFKEFKQLIAMFYRFLVVFLCVQRLMESTFLYIYNFTRYHEDTDKEGETLTVVPKETGEKTYLSLVGKQFAS